MRIHPEGRKRLKKLMLIQGTAQRELAKAIGWKSHTYLGRSLAGTVNTMDLDAAVRIAHFFEVGVDDLFLVESSSDSRHSGKQGAA